MKIAEWSIQKKSFVLFVTVLLAIGGVWAYLGLGRLEDPDFTVKTALVITQYPGASPEEVEEEVTDEVEQALQRLAQLKRVRSRSSRGLSVIYADIKDGYNAEELNQVWDELRRKVGEAQRHLPPGAGPSMVNDDFGDVYGVVFALTGDGYSMADLKRYGEDIKKELLLIPGVARVSLWGDQVETVFVEIRRSKLVDLGISPEQIAATLHGQNLVTDAGSVKAGMERIAIDPAGAFESVDEIGDLLIRGSRSGRLVYLRDIAHIYRGYQSPPSRMMSFNGKSAIALGVSTVPGGNVVSMGESVKSELYELEGDLPVGVEIETVTYQSDLVLDAVNGFVLNLAEAVSIVIVLLVLCMGWVSGLLIGAILLLTIAGTFIAMRIMGVDLHSVSLGALIICLGMLVDNAIVVTEGILIGVSLGQDRELTAIRIVKETKWPLLGATVVAILAFAAIGLSPDITGEFCRSLFQVVAASLLISWVLAVTVTPLLGVMFLKKNGDGLSDDPHGGRGYEFYRKFLGHCIHHRWATIWTMVMLLGLAVYGFGFVGQMFFPEMVRDQFMIHFWLPEGADIEETDEDLKAISRHFIESEKSVVSVAAFAGEGPLRFYLSMEPQLKDSSYGFLLVTVKDYKDLAGVIDRQAQWLSNSFPEAEPRVEMFKKGPGSGPKVKLRIYGDDPSVLRDFSGQVQNIMASEPYAVDIRDDWRQPVKILRPEIDEARTRRSGLTRGDVASAMKRTFNGRIVGVYREGDNLLPIITRSPIEERSDLDSVSDVQIWSRGLMRFVPAEQVFSKVGLMWEDPLIRRRDRIRVITPQCDPSRCTAEELRARLAEKIGEIKLPYNYKFEWGGEYESSRDSERALMGPLGISFILMLIVVMSLFNSYRQTAVVFLCLPLAAIGVTAGLLMTGKSFGFMALLGYLSLAGMLIKNAIVLLDQIGIEQDKGKGRFIAVVDASVGRIRPVMMASMTTVLGMTPLAFNDFFASMAVTIMSGLTFATVLTLIVVPVLYCTLFKITDPRRAEHA